MEKRQHPRQRALLNATALFSEGRFSLPCLVRDVSEGGMRLTVSEAIILPDAFELSVPSQRLVHQVRVRWRRGEHVGVALRGELRASTSGTPPPPQSTQLRNLAQEVARLESLVAELAQERDALRRLLGLASERLREAGLSRPAAAERAPTHQDDYGSCRFDVFDDETCDWADRPSD